MSTHPNAAVIDRMTKAVFENDRATLAEVFTADLAFHVRGPLPTPGDHTGVDGFLHTIATIFELTGGDVTIEQLSCLADGQWATEWEHAVMGRSGATLDTNNAFVYRFADGRIAEMWMICAAPPEAASFWD
jgi:ketosteroid isomerase-like protein